MDLVLVLFLFFVLAMLVTGIVHLVSGVPYVPTPHRVVKRMVEIAELEKGEVVYDLGCGDGRLVFAAEEVTEKRCVGYELAPVPYFFAWVWKKLKGAKSDIYLRSLFVADLRDADVVFCYLMPHMLKKLTAKLTNECRKGTRIVSHGFKIEGLEPKKTFARDKASGMPTIHLYVL